MGQILLRQSTASQVVWLGPFVDTAGAAVTSLTIANTDIKIRKLGSTAAVSKNSGGATHDANGRYYCTFDATDTNTLGSGRVDLTMSGALAVWHHFTVLPAEVYDSIVLGTGNGLRVDVRALLGTAWLTPSVAGTPDVNTKLIGGQTVTASSGVTFPSSVGTSTLTQTQVTGGAYSVQSALCVLGDARIANLDATVSSRQATFTAAVSISFPTNFGTLGINVSGHIDRVTLVDTVTTLTNMPTTPDNAGITKILSAVYDSASKVGDVVTLSSGAVLTYSATGRVRVGG